MHEKNLEKPTPFKRAIDAVHKTMKAQEKKKKKDERERVVTEKELDQWMTNINYFSTRFRNDLYECLDVDAAHAIPGCSELDLEEVCSEALRIVPASEIMKIGRRLPKELRDDFLNEWILPRTRSNVKQKTRGDGNFASILGANYDVFESLDCFARTFDCAIQQERFEELKDEVAAEATFYDDLRKDSDRITVAYRQLLPIWILKQSSPLYDLSRLSFWRDPTYMEYVCEEICGGFKDYDDDKTFIAGGQVGAQARQQVKKKNVELSKQLADIGESESAYGDMGVVELYELLYGDSIDADYEFLDLKEPFPEEATILAKLVWNLCACTILGPAQMTDWRTIYTKPANDWTELLRVTDMTADLCLGAGSVSVMRVFPGGRTEFAFGIDLGSGGADDSAPPPGLVAAIGRASTPDYRPAPQFDEAAATELHRLVMEGRPQEELLYKATECDGDSAWHVGFVLSGDPAGASHAALRLYIVDLGSANGTRVVRADDDGEHVFLFGGRPPVGDKLTRLRKSLTADGLDADAAREVGYLEARRNDVIMLNDSQFILQ